MATRNQKATTRSQEASKRAKADGGRMTEIVEASAKMFRKKGYSATSIQNIADEIGILKGSLYHYIDTKEDLLFAIVGRMTSAAEDLCELAEAGLAERMAVPTMMEIIRGHVAMEAENPVESTVFFRDGRHLEGARRTSVVAVATRYERSWRSLIEHGQRAGEIREDLDATLAAAGILGMLNSIHIWYLADRHQATQNEIVTAYTGIILGGVLPPAAARRANRTALGA